MTEYVDLGRGAAWEYRVQRAAMVSGWYARRSINLRERVLGTPQTLAEVDVFGLGFDPALTQRILVGECKDRKGATKEADRVTWLLGLARILKADHVLFAKTSLGDAVVQFSRPLGLLLWDRATVQSIEQGYGLGDSEDFFGSFNVGLQEDVLRPARKASAFKSQALRAAWEFLSGSFWYTNTPVRTKRLAGYFDALTDTKGLTSIVRSSFVAEGLMALLVCGYATAGQLLRLSPARGTAHQTDLFSAGAADATALREIAARADDYYQDALVKLARSSDRGDQTTSVPRLVNTIAQPPSWLDAYLEFGRRLARRPSLATDALRYADVILFEELLAAGDGTRYVEKTIADRPHELHGVLELASLFLQRVWNIEDPLLEGVLNLRVQKRPKTKAKATPKPEALFAEGERK